MKIKFFDIVCEECHETHGGQTAELLSKADWWKPKVFCSKKCRNDFIDNNPGILD